MHNILQRLYFAKSHQKSFHKCKFHNTTSLPLRLAMLKILADVIFANLPKILEIFQASKFFRPRNMCYTVVDLENW